MILFLEATMSPGYMALYDKKRKKISAKKIFLTNNESRLLIKTVDIFFQENNIDFNQIQNIIVVNGPGSFTGIRTISLYINTILYMYPHISLTPVSFFDTFKNYPIIKESSRRDLFVQKEKSAIIEIMQNDDFLFYCQDKKISKVFGYSSQIFEIFENNLIDNRNFDEYVKQLDLQNEKKLLPLYIKKPNIC